MLLVPHVCAEFYDRARQKIFAIEPYMLNSFTEAPEAIRQDPLFDLLLADGSLEAAETVAQQKQLEADPTAGITAEGKKPKAKKPAASAKSTPAKTSGSGAENEPAPSADQPSAETPAEESGK